MPCLSYIVVQLRSIVIESVCNFYFIITFNFVIWYFCFVLEPINIFHGGNTSESSSNPPIKLSYQRGSHYNSIVDPHKATIGIGLGLPNFSPGSADKKLLNDAVMQSEDLMLEQV